jgi:lipopolysaccharide export LptBFGC system permease protein LptF
VLAGKLGNYCLNCFNNLEKRKKEKVRKKANQLKFWAKSGYYLFIILMAIAVFSFSLMALNKVFFIVGLIVVIIDGLYGGLLYKFLSQS